MLRGSWAERGGTVSTQVKMADGTQTDLIEHLQVEHKKGTAGFTDEYLATMHDSLHQRRRDPFPEHDHLLAGIPMQRSPVD